MTNADFDDIARRAGSLLAATGFATTNEIVDAISDNGSLEMRSGDVVVRLVRDRRQWFVEIRSAAKDEWFDSRYVLAVVGDEQAWAPPTNEAELRTFVQHLIELLPHWRLLFHPEMYQQSKQEINERERAYARKNFSYKPNR